MWIPSRRHSKVNLSFMRMLQKDLRNFSPYTPPFFYFFPLSLLNPLRKNPLAISSSLLRSIRDREKCPSGFLRMITPACSSSLISDVPISQAHLLEPHRRFSTTPCLHHSYSLHHGAFSILSEESIEEGRKEEKKWERIEENNPRVSAKGGAHHSLSSTCRTLRLHNLPKNWLHEDIIQFIEQVASHAGIPPPPPPSPSSSSEAAPHVTSPFVHHLTIFFGRRTGIVFGSPKIVLTSSPLCDVLLQGVPFEEEDYRSRIYFTEEAGSPSTASPLSSSADPPASLLSASSSLPPSSSLQAIKETLEEEQQVALEQLELDRFLFSPDLLYDIARLHQRRLVTRSESVLLRSFRDASNDDEDQNEDEEIREDFEGEVSHSGSEREHLRFTDDDAANDTLPSQRFGIVRKSKVKNKRRQKKKQEKSSLAGDQSDLGRGSMHNIPIPKPYVEGRRV